MKKDIVITILVGILSFVGGLFTMEALLLTNKKALTFMNKLHELIIKHS